MRRVLFVDDEPRILEGIENLMFDLLDDWDMEFATSGPEALLLLDEEETFDVLVTDMRMPGMDGAELLERVKAAHPEVVRLVLSGHSELSAARRALPIAHQYLSKPCEPDTLTRVLTRAANLNDLITNRDIRSMIGDITKLPARPLVYTQLKSLLNTEDWSLADVAGIVEQDLAISTKILQVGNTAFFSRGGRACNDVREVVARIGAKYVSELVLSFETRNAFPDCPGIDLDALHREALDVATLAKQIGTGPGMEDVFLAGLVHDIGRLVLAANRKKDYEALTKSGVGEGAELVGAEMKHFGTSHAEAGAYFVGLWGMSYDVIEAVGHHHRPDRLCQDSLGVPGAVFLADQLYRAARTETEMETAAFEYIERLGLRSQLEDWQETAAAIGLS